MKNNYDIIGDIHGHADTLIRLLEKLGYSFNGKSYTHESRQAIFLGDFIDRGPKQRGVLEVVMSMVNSGAAKTVLANHEFNALAYHTEDPESPNTWLRPRNNKNTHQHLAFLNEYLSPKHSGELEKALEWFMTLPLWLDLGGFRVVHACWHQESIDKLTGHLGPDNNLTKDLLVKASRKGSEEFEAVETLLKGWEIALPQNASFKDKDGTLRSKVRSKWWIEEDSILPDVVFDSEEVKSKMPQVTISNSTLPGYGANEKPVFVGHYWMTGDVQPLTKNVACVDYSVAKNGKLVAYRWDGESILSENKFVWVES